MYKPVYINVAFPSWTIAINGTGDIQFLIIIITYTNLKVARARARPQNVQREVIIERINGYLH